MMYNNRVHLQGGGAGGGNYKQQMKQDRELAERKEARKGNFKDTDAMYRFLSEGADPIYREEAFRDTDFQDYHKALGKDSLAYKDANIYKTAILRAGDPRGIFTGEITNPMYGTPEEVAKSQNYLNHFNRMTSALGMDAAGMAAGVQPQTVLSTFPGANPQPTAAPSEPAPPVLPAMTAADRGYKPFMTIDEGQEYYGQFMANGGVVPNTLRRKMFSLGGNVPGHHGVGITSGMRYNKGGTVKPGPDGRPRVHAASGVLAGLASALGLKAVKPIYQAIRGGTTKPIKDFVTKKRPMTREEIRKLLGKPGKLGTSKLDSAARATIREGVDDGISKSGIANLAGLLTAGGVGATGAATAMAERLGMDDNAFMQSAGMQNFIKPVAEGALDFSIPGIGYNVYKGFTTPADEFELTRLSDVIANRDGSDTESTEITPGEETVGKAVARMSEEDRLRQDFETRKALYQELMSSDEKTNNLGVLGRSLLEASEALNQGKGFISAGNVFGTGIADEVDRREQRLADIRDAAATQAITDVMGSRAQREAAVQEAVLTGNTEYVRILDAVDAAQAAGIPLEDVPTDGNEEDVEAMKKRPGTVFMDTQNLIGQGIFVAVNSRGDIRSFNDVNTAIEFAST